MLKGKVEGKRREEKERRGEKKGRPHVILH